MAWPPEPHFAHPRPHCKRPAGHCAPESPHTRRRGRDRLFDNGGRDRQARAFIRRTSSWTEPEPQDDLGQGDRLWASSDASFRCGGGGRRRGSWKLSRAGGLGRWRVQGPRPSSITVPRPTSVPARGNSSPEQIVQWGLDGESGVRPTGGPVSDAQPVGILYRPSRASFARRDGVRRFTPTSTPPHRAIRLKATRPVWLRGPDRGSTRAGWRGFSIECDEARATARSAAEGAHLRAILVDPPGLLEDARPTARSGTCSEHLPVLYGTSRRQAPCRTQPELRHSSPAYAVRLSFMTLPRSCIALTRLGARGGRIRRRGELVTRDQAKRPSTSHLALRAVDPGGSSVSDHPRVREVTSLSNTTVKELRGSARPQRAGARAGCSWPRARARRSRRSTTAARPEIPGLSPRGAASATWCAACGRPVPRGGRRMPGRSTTRCSPRSRGRTTRRVLSPPSAGRAGASTRSTRRLAGSSSRSIGCATPAIWARSCARGTRWVRGGVLWSARLCRSRPPWEAVRASMGSIFAVPRSRGRKPSSWRSPPVGSGAWSETALPASKHYRPRGLCGRRSCSPWATSRRASRRRSPRPAPTSCAFHAGPRRQPQPRDRDRGGALRHRRAGRSDGRGLNGPALTTRAAPSPRSGGAAAARRTRGRTPRRACRPRASARRRGCPWR